MLEQLQIQVTAAEKSTSPAWSCSTVRLAASSGYGRRTARKCINHQGRPVGTRQESCLLALEHSWLAGDSPVKTAQSVLSRERASMCQLAAATVSRRAET